MKRNNNEKRITPSFDAIFTFIILDISILAITIACCCTQILGLIIIMALFFIFCLIATYFCFGAADKVYYNQAEKYFRINNKKININDIEYCQKLKINSLKNHYNFKLKNGKSVVFLIANYRYDYIEFVNLINYLEIPLKKEKVIKKNFKKSDFKLKKLGGNKKVLFSIFLILLLVLDITIIFAIIWIIGESDSFLLSRTFGGIIGALIYNYYLLLLLFDYGKCIKNNSNIEYNTQSDIMIANGIQHKISDLSHVEFNKRIVTFYKKDGTFFKYFYPMLETRELLYVLEQFGINNIPKNNGQ